MPLQVSQSPYTFILNIFDVTEKNPRVDTFSVKLAGNMQMFARTAPRRTGYSDWFCGGYLFSFTHQNTRKLGKRRKKLFYNT